MIRFRKLVAGTSLIIAPACGLAWSLTQDPFTGYANELTFVSEHMNRWVMGTYLGILMSYIFIPAILGVIHLVEQRSAVLAYLGGGLACVGAAFHGSVLGFQLAEAPLTASGLDGERLTAITMSLYDHPAFTMIVMPVFALYAGLLLLSIAIWRSRGIGIWVPLLIVSGIGIELFSTLDFKARIMFVFFLIAFGGLGVKILRMTDSAWMQLGRSLDDNASMS
jgi:hypothetical protein